MAETIIKAKFFRDWVWFWLIFLVLIGIPALVFGIVGIIYALIYVKGVVTLGVIMVFLAPAVFGWMLFFFFLCTLKQRVVFSPSYIEYIHPSYVLFGTKKTRVQTKDIQAAALGFYVMGKIFPEGMKSKTMSLIPRKLFIKIKYVQDGETLSIELPKFDNPQYFSELRNLIKNANLKQTELAFVFKK